MFIGRKTTIQDLVYTQVVGRVLTEDQQDKALDNKAVKQLQDKSSRLSPQQTLLKVRAS